MSSNPRTYLSLLACAAALALAIAGCGSNEDKGDPIPRGVSSAISLELTSVQNRLDYARGHATPGGEGACNDIENKSFPAIARELGRVPNGVKKDVRDALTQSVDNLQALTRTECDKVSSKANETDTTTTETPPATVPQPESPTVPQDTTPTTPTTPEKTKKPEKQPKQQLPGQGDGQPGTGGGGAGAPETP